MLSRVTPSVLAPLSTPTSAATFPAAVGNGLTMAIISLGPCSMLAPHYHPRASNYVVAVTGTTVTHFIEENGARLVTNTLTPGKMTIFPQASLHTMVNTGEWPLAMTSPLFLHCPNPSSQGLVMPRRLTCFPEGCENAQLVSALANEDQGTHNVANGLFNLPSDLVSVALGYSGQVNQSANAIPGVGTGSIAGTKECLEACKMNGTYVRREFQA
ncbi:MAG: hypothetical protein M1830_008825 [Pleopsidium flavum]|nr:MAG: hypothetical protein M1830_008825 [Pleopsidium flavum]